MVMRHSVGYRDLEEKMTERDLSLEHTTKSAGAYIVPLVISPLIDYPIIVSRFFVCAAGAAQKGD